MKNYKCLVNNCENSNDVDCQAKNLNLQNNKCYLENDHFKIDENDHFKIDQNFKIDEND